MRLINELLIDMEKLKTVLVSKATGGDSNEQEYRSLREKLIKVDRIKTAFHVSFLLAVLCPSFGDISPKYHRHTEDVENIYGTLSIIF